MNVRKLIQSNTGITLIALVVTIVVLLILAGITISLVFSDNGIIAKAREAAEKTNQAVINEQESINELTDYMTNILNEIGEGNNQEGTIGPNGKPLVETLTEIQTSNNVEAEDKYGNSVTVPKGFKVVINETAIVPEGIVIEDANGNQFVWIPVGTVHKDNNPANDVTIELGRYTFDTTTGDPTSVQLAYTNENLTNYRNEIPIEGHNNHEFIEVDESRSGIIDTDNRLNDLNATAKNLTSFVQSVKDNGGYYLARYEASYGSGYDSEGSTDLEKYANAKPLSKVSKANSKDNMNYITGTLWNFITQLNASKVCQNMYANDNTVGVESDLVNSYAWDTAIVFIQAMNEVNSNYANKKDGSETLKDTGTTEDEVCNIFDMASNIREWTTEYVTALGCNRGGYYFNDTAYTVGRYENYVDNYSERLGFRIILYAK